MKWSELELKIPFLKPNLVKREEYTSYLDLIDESRIYSNYGNLNTEFEKRILRDYFDDKGYVSTVNNATIGLILSIMLSKRKGKYAIMPSFTFSATAQAALWCGLEPLFIDIRPEDWCMNEQIVQEFIEKLGDEVGVVVPYATFGTVIDLSYYQGLLDNGIPVVVDAAASFGSTYNGRGLESTFSGPIVYSFHATKSFGIGEGGLVYSKDRLFIKNLRSMGNFGFDGSRETKQLGLNSKLSEYAAAIGLATLNTFSNKSRIRQEVKSLYESKMNTLGLLKKGWVFHNSKGEVAHQNVSVLCPSFLNNQNVINELENYGIEARSYFSPACHQQEFFSEFRSSSLEYTIEISKRVINLPLWEELTEVEIDYIVDALHEITIPQGKDL